MTEFTPRYLKDYQAPEFAIKTVDLTGGQHTVEVYYWDQGGQYIFDLQLLDSSDNNVWVTENLSTPVSSPITTNEETAVLIDLDDKYSKETHYEYYRYVDDILILCNEKDVKSIFDTLDIDMNNLKLKI